MDSEEHHELQELVNKGVSSSNEGPFYHHAFWQSYKGATKGKLGGLVIGGLIGLTTGIVAFSLLSLLATPLGIAGAALSATTIIGGMAGAGMIYGAAEFGEVGRITGATAAASKESEARMHEFELAKFTEIKQELGEIKTLIGKPASNEENYQNQTSAASVAGAAAGGMGLADTMKKLADHRITHLRPELVTSNTNKIVFWDVAFVGLIVGAGIGLLVAAGTVAAVGAAGVAATTGAAAATSIGAEVLTHLGVGALAGNSAALAIVFGAIGASFGINRDTLRKVFDKTDPLFKGMFNFNDGKVPPQLEQQLQPQVQAQQAPQPSQLVSASKEQPKEPKVSTLVYYNHDDNAQNEDPEFFQKKYAKAPVSETLLYGDKVKANSLLASMDTTKSIRQ